MDCCNKTGKKSTKQSIVFNSFSPNRRFRIKGEAGHSFLFLPGEEGGACSMGEGVGPWSMLA